MDRLLRLWTPVLLYHGSYPEVPPELGGGLHNVTPQQLIEHTRYLRQYVRFVPIDELVTADKHHGLAAVTFDDAYRSVHEHVAGLLIEEGIPFTIFVNGSSLDGEVLWRDKVRIVISNDWVEECEAELPAGMKIPDLSFYKYTKDPRNDSAAVDAAITRFLDSKGALTALRPPTVDRPDGFIHDPLVTYGNHSHHHYVLSSLTKEQQREEILRTEATLDGIPGIGRSRVFSVPFGERKHFNAETIEVLKELGFSAAVLSRQRLNLRRRQLDGFPLLERFMPADDRLGPQLIRFKSLASA
ncbi:MAG: polysaccharide deacetylase family protein [Candidatus Eisenbacteria bacterium]